MNSTTIDPASIALKVRAGTLPHVAPIETWGGKSEKAQSCAGCESLLRAADLHIEAVFADDLRLVFHPPCFLAWRGVMDALEARP